MTGNLLVFLGAALASAVEMVEALTIVLALGVTRGWRAPLQGAVAALVVLVVLVAALGPALEAVRSTCCGSSSARSCSSSASSGCARRSSARAGSRPCTTRT